MQGKWYVHTLSAEGKAYIRSCHRRVPSIRLLVLLFSTIPRHGSRIPVCQLRNFCKSITGSLIRNRMIHSLPLARYTWQSGQQHCRLRGKQNWQRSNLLKNSPRKHARINWKKALQSVRSCMRQQRPQSEHGRSSCSGTRHSQMNLRHFLLIRLGLHASRRTVLSAVAKNYWL